MAKKTAKSTKEFDVRQLITFLCQMALGSIFIIASLDKIQRPEAFAQVIENYEILPIPIINIFAIVLPWLELLCGVMLLFGVWVRSNSLLVTGMLVMFLFAMGSAMARGLEINCGCFDTVSDEDNVGWVRIFQDMGMMVLGVWMIYFPRTLFTLEPVLDKVLRKKAQQT